ncbi:HBS1-like protein isoform X2 [Antedon mediterranea]
MTPPSSVVNLHSPPKPTSSLVSLLNQSKLKGKEGNRNKEVGSYDGTTLGKEGLGGQIVPLANLGKKTRHVSATPLCNLAKMHLGSGPKANPGRGQSLSALANVRFHSSGKSCSEKDSNGQTSAKAVSLSALASNHLSGSPQNKIVGGVQFGSPGGGASLNALATTHLNKEQSIPVPKITKTTQTSIIALKKSTIDCQSSSSPEETVTHRPRNARRRRQKGHQKEKDQMVVEIGNQPKIIPQIFNEQESEPALMARMSAFSKAVCAELQTRVLPGHLQSLSTSPYHQSLSPPELPCADTFQYKRQLSENLYQSYKAIVPFDFLTPSPDDIIKERQSKAFKRTKGDSVNVTTSDSALTVPLQPPPTKKNVTSPTRSVTRGFNVTSDDSGMGKRFSVDSGRKAELLAHPKLPTVRSTPDLLSMAGSTIPKNKSGKLSIDISKAFEERQSGKPLLNLVVIGHVDAGKSTLMGHLLHQLGNVNQKTMHKYEQESKKQGKASFAYAWVLDETGEERQRGITMDVGINKFETEHRIITLLDAPGHKDFIPNMITGAAQADVAVLVVDATRGEFETGFDSGGQTREHAMLVRSLGVTQLVVAVNKLDTVDWSEDRFTEIVNKLSQFLKQVAGFKESDLVYVPCSGLTGENLAKRTHEKLLRQWYKNKCLLEYIDSLKPPKRSIDKPFRLCVSDVFKGMGSGFSLSGKIVSGSVQAGQKVVVMPAGDTGVVKSVFIHEEDVKWACAGDHTTLTITGIDQMNVTVGNILCSADQPITSCVRFRARVITFNLDIPITKGFQVLMHYQTLSEPATVRKLISILHKSTGEVLKQRPRCLTKQTNAVIEIDVSRPISLELYKDYKDLGRFMLRYSGSTIAAGVVIDILK